MRGWCGFLAVIALGAVSPAQAIDWPAVRDRTRTDTSSLVTIDRKPTATQLGLGAAALALLAATDAHVSDEAQRHLPGSLVHLQSGGTQGAANLVALGMVGEGLLLSDRRGTVGGLTLLEGDVLLDLVLQASKRAFGRVRPDRTQAGDFFRGGDSFPSSHAAHAFLIAAALDAAVDRPAWRWVFYPLAGGVALERLQQGVHFPTDVAVGGLLGWWIGHRLAVAHELVPRPGGARVGLLPVRGGAIVTVGWSR
ncbi:MAG TPA: phosphatase PAP2 family protein [Thermoanaerobaculaceae bacterium]|nr:phosphatase PAP2 family protein [Thermoanaerobaculaceae bacterium]